MEDFKIEEPHLPEDFKLILQQLDKIVEIYHELIMAWARPPVIYKSEKKEE